MTKYGQELKQIRLANNLSQTQLSKNTGISQQNISRWEKGEIIPTIYFCELLADYFEITIDELIGREFIPYGKTHISNTINDNHGTIKIKNG